MAIIIPQTSIHRSKAVFRAASTTNASSCIAKNAIPTRLLRVRRPIPVTAHKYVTRLQPLLLLLIILVAGLPPPRGMHLTPFLSSSSVLFPFPMLLGAHAFGTGAGGCVGGQAAVGGLHLDSANGRTVAVGELAQGEVSVLIDETNRLIPITPYAVNTQTEYRLTVRTENPNGFKGILIRLGSSSGSGTTIAPGDGTAANLQDAMECQAATDATGVTHTDDTAKTSVTALVRFDAPGTIALDVTIVGINDATASVYGYNGFTLQVTGEPAPTSPAPVLAPGETVPPSPSPSVSDILGTTLSPTYTMPSSSDTSLAAGARMPNLTVLLLPTIVLSLCLVGPVLAHSWFGPIV